MSAHKSIDKICAVIAALTLVLTVLFCNGQAFGIGTTAHAIGYENRLFDRSRVHTFDIVIGDWDAFLETCESEAYSPCTVIIDGESVKNVGIRGKGNTSLSSVRNMGSSRYSFKIEFDQYDSTKSYHGLDKLCLNNIIQDNTYMKDYLSYSLMYDFGAPAPLCSYAYITVNGEDWGLYLAVEAIEESFLTRNYGSNYGDLYKPDAMSFGGGRGNGKDFSMSEFMNKDDGEAEKTDGAAGSSQNSGRQRGGGPGFGGGMPDFGNGEMPDFGNMPDFGGKMPQFNPDNMPSDFDFSDFDPSGMFGGEMPDFGGGEGGKGGFGMGSSDVKLQYTDDDPDSYSNIFNNAKTAVTKADKKRLIASLKALSEQTDLESTLDTDAVLRYFVVHNFLCNGDSYTGQMIHNYYLYEKNGQLSMIPWDYNLAYGSFMGGNASSSVNAAIDTPVSGDMSDRPMVSWIFDSAEYTEKYHQLFREFLDSADFAAMIDETAALIGEYVEKDPTKFCTCEEYEKGVAAIKAFCTLREQSVSGQLDGTIPSTSDGQKADSSALIDTAGLNISDMGSMGGAGGFGGGGKGGFGGRPGRSGDQDSAAQEGQTGSGESGQKPERSGRRGKSEQQEQSGASVLSFGSGSRVTAQSLAARPGFGGGQMPEGFDPDNMPEGFDPGNMPGGFGGGEMPQGFDPNNMPGGAGNGQPPQGFDPDNMPEGFEPGNMPENVSGSQDDGSGDAAEDAAAPAEQPEKPAQKAGSTNGSRPQPGGSFPGMSGNAQTDHTTDYILVGISVLVLLTGLGFALKFKR